MTKTATWSHWMKRAESTAEFLKTEQWGSAEDNNFDDIQFAPNPEYYKGAVSLDELEEVIRNSNTWKATGLDKMSYDMLKDLNEENKMKLLFTVNRIWETKELERDMLNTKIASLYKKSDP